MWVPGPRAHHLLHLSTQLRQLASHFSSCLPQMSNCSPLPLMRLNYLSLLFLQSGAHAELVHLFSFSFHNSKAPYGSPGLTSSTQPRERSSWNSLSFLLLPTVSITEKTSQEAIYAPCCGGQSWATFCIWPGSPPSAPFTSLRPP